jgi:K+ transporter
VATAVDYRDDVHHHDHLAACSAIITRKRETVEGPLQGFVDQLSRRRGLLTARVGYIETPDVHSAFRVLEPKEAEELIAIDDASHFLSKIEPTKGGDHSMPAWRKNPNLFIATSRLSTRGAEFFCLPQDRTLIEGSRIEEASGRSVRSFAADSHCCTEVVLKMGQQISVAE